MQKQSLLGRYYQGSWEFEFFIVRTSSEGNLAGTVEIRRAGVTKGVLASAGVFKAKQQLASHLKDRALRWVRHAEPPLENNRGAPLPR